MVHQLTVRADLTDVGVQCLHLKKEPVALKLVHLTNGSPNIHLSASPNGQQLQQAQSNVQQPSKADKLLSADLLLADVEQLAKIQQALAVKQRPSEQPLATSATLATSAPAPEAAPTNTKHLPGAKQIPKSLAPSSQLTLSAQPTNQQRRTDNQLPLAATPNQCGYPKRVRSLVDDAKFDTIKNRELNESFDSSQDFKLQPTGNGVPKVAEAAELATESAKPQPMDFPRHISQLDQCNHLLIKYEPELDPTHPGFHDLEYRERRKEVAQIAFNYKHGQRIPEVDYNAKEIDTWRFIYIRLKEAYAKYACRQHNEAIRQLELHCGYSADEIPQLQRVSEFLERRTGWRLRPAAGLLSARDFLASLAFRVFQTTQYIRHWGNPEHSVEPDCIHELMGHIPMLCDPSFAQFSQEIGLASLGASDEQIEKFATLYWFTVEFGLCREQGQLKCYGAGLLSSYGEMEHALESGKPALKEFVPEETAVESYDDAEYQVSYYVAQSFDDAKMKIKQYAAKHLNRDFELTYEPFSCRVLVLDSLDQLDQLADAIKGDIMRLSSAIGKIRHQQLSENATPNKLDIGTNGTCMTNGYC